MTARLYIKRDLSFELSDINVLDANEKELLQISKELGIGLSLDEMKRVKEYFSNMERNPTDVELQTIGQTWSEHCYHKTLEDYLATLSLSLFQCQIPLRKWKRREDTPNQFDISMADPQKTMSCIDR